MKALVTGSAGFVGRHLIPKLLQHSAGFSEIHAVDIANTTDLDRTFPLKGMFVRSQSEFTGAGHLVTMHGGIDHFLDIAAHGQLKPYDIVVHLAANIVNVDARMKGGMEAYGDIELDLAMCRWLEKNPPKQCAVLMSSCAVDYPEDPYCIVKRNLESFAQTLHKKGVPVIVLRPFSGYGEDQSEEYPFRAILERALRKEDPLTVWGGSQVRDWIHIDDLTDAILFALKNVSPSPLPIEVGTMRGVSLSRFAKMMTDACGYDPRFFFDASKSNSSSRRVAGEGEGLVGRLQRYGWEPKIVLETAIARAVASRQKVEASCPV